MNKFTFKLNPSTTTLVKSFASPAIQFVTHEQPADKSIGLIARWDLAWSSKH
jgi:hypothetical protein